MAIYLGQLPPAEVARLKAELAETLIANFCYPRFYDYRTNSLRMRPIDRSKRQEVWLYLSSIDFTSWSRIDLLSPDFQYQIERLFIHFVQRNRSFFGQQGRKRMPDVRMLINSSATSVTEGLRGHLTGRHVTNPPFGSPRPVTSWSTTNIELGWEQINPATMLLQQHLQELRNETKSAPKEEKRQPATSTPPKTPTTPTTPPRRSTRRTSGNGADSRVPQPVEHEVQQPKPTPINRPTVQVQEEAPANPPQPGPKTAVPVNSSSSISVSPPASTSAPGSVPAPTPAPTASPLRKSEPAITPNNITAPPPEKVPVTVVPQSPTKQPQPEQMQPQPPVTPLKEQSHEVVQLTQEPLAGVPATTAQSAAVIPSDEDMVIFEQLRYQLVLWLRVEAVRSGADIAGHGPTELLDLLRQQGSIDDTRLQVVSTLLNISNSVITNGRASLLDYKQAIMFYLMHTRR